MHARRGDPRVGKGRCPRRLHPPSAFAHGAWMLPAFALVLYGGCGDDDDGGTAPIFDSGAMTSDSGPSNRDASSPPLPPPGDAGGGADSSGPMPPPAMPDPPMSCGNLRSDEPFGRDCEDVATCGSMPICCADSAVAGCCAPSASAESFFDFSTCFASGTGCLSGFDVAGLPTPRDQMAGSELLLWLGGSADAEGVALAREPLDPSGALEASASVVILAGCEAAGRCAETVAVGLTESDRADGATDRALAAVISLDTAQLLLVQGGAVLARTPFPVGASSLSLGVGLTADGRLVGSVDGEVRLAATLDAPSRRPVRAVLFGRGGNGSDNHVFVRSIATAGEACDRPRAFVVGEDPVAMRQLEGGASANVVVDRIVGGESSDGVRRLVLSERGTLRAARQDADGTLLVDVVSPSALVPPPDRSVTLAGLEARSADDWRLYVLLDGIDLYAYPGDGSTFDATMPTPVTGAAELGVASLESPSVARTETGALVVAFVTRDDGTGAPAIRTATGFEGAMRLDEASVVPSEDSASFDRDGVSSPALVVSRGLVDLYYVGRRGVTESIGLARRSGSDNPWVRYAASPVLTPGAATWSSIAVGAPALVLGPASGGITRLDLLFVGYDGANRALGLATRIVPE
ncbi:MAG: hypothetical protein IT379_28130 [Deltaproteobacteria bacterium]|nr:hypothetical protein [Deltaproteobacteria bacterium]